MQNHESKLYLDIIILAVNTTEHRHLAVILGHIVEGGVPLLAARSAA